MNGRTLIVFANLRGEGKSHSVTLIFIFKLLWQDDFLLLCCQGDHLNNICYFFKVVLLKLGHCSDNLKKGKKLFWSPSVVFNYFVNLKIKGQRERQQMFAIKKELQFWEAQSQAETQIVF